jgi:hypothetical protein
MLHLKIDIYGSIGTKSAWSVSFMHLIMKRNEETMCE